MFSYVNREVKVVGGKKIVRTVRVQRGCGTKTVAHYHRGKCTHRSTKPLCKHSLRMIKRGKFVKGLFDECHPTKATTRRRRH